MALLDSAPRSVSLEHDSIERYLPEYFQVLLCLERAAVYPDVHAVHGQKRLKLGHGASERVHDRSTKAVLW